MIRLFEQCQPIPHYGLLMSLVIAFSNTVAHSQVRPTSSQPPAAPMVETNPLADFERLASHSDLTDTKDVWMLVHAAYERTLYGTSRKLARRVLQLEPDYTKARHYLGYALVRQGNSSHWLDSFEVRMHGAGKFRDPKYGWILEADRGHLADEMLRATDGTLRSVSDLDLAHGIWLQRRTVQSRFFDVIGCIPLEAMWYVADDLDALTIAYCDFFELPRLPMKRFAVHLYRAAEDAEAAGADGALLKRYGAYFKDETLHVMFKSIGGLTAVRHEAAHALNRVYIKRLPQWIDEGIGVYCQFLHVGADQTFEFGRFPQHGFGLQFVEEVQQGREEDLRTIAATALVTTNSHYYSKFRAMVDFFMSGEEQKHRLQFINAVFRNHGKVEDLLATSGINEAWLAYVKTLKPSREWCYIPDRERAESVKLLLVNPAAPQQQPRR